MNENLKPHYHHQSSLRATGDEGRSGLSQTRPEDRGDTFSTHVDEEDNRDFDPWPVMMGGF